MTFKQYMLARRGEDTPEGDFIDDSLSEDFPDDMKTLRQLETFMETTGSPCPQAYDAAKNLWRDYRHARELENFVKELRNDCHA